MVVNDHEYSKHYYIEGQRICSKLGGGMQNNLIDIHDQIVGTIYSDFDQLSITSAEKMQRDIECVGPLGYVEVNQAPFVEFVNGLPDVDNPETDLYFYQSDHLGSSSFITDVNGVTSQHLQYLPFGELFVEQRDNSNYYSPYKFSAKEKDEETGYNYHVQRYYIPDYSFWPTVDQKADDYPYQSPYTYSGWNPINIIDPDGMDEWEVDKATGKMKNVLTTDNDVIYQTVDGKRTGIEQAFDGKVITLKKEGTQNVKGEKLPVGFTDLFFNNESNSDKGFNFLADNTDVEWSKINADNLVIPDNPNNSNNSIHTSHKNDKEYRGASLSINMSPKEYKVTNFSHNHPIHNDDDYTSMADRKHRDELMKNFPNCEFILRYSGQQRSYKKDNILNNYDKNRNRQKSKVF